MNNYRLYKAMVKSIKEYAAVVWEPHTKRDIDMIEGTQQQAARFVTSNYSRYASVMQMLTDLNWPTLARCRDELKAIMMFKIINRHLVDIPANLFLTPISTVHSTRGHNNMRFMQPMTRIDSYMYSFSLRQSKSGMIYPKM